MALYETLDAAAAAVGLDEWLCVYPEEIWGKASPAWDAPLTDAQFADVLGTAEEEGW